MDYQLDDFERRNVLRMICFHRRGVWRCRSIRGLYQLLQQPDALKEVETVRRVVRYIHEESWDKVLMLEYASRIGKTLPKPSVKQNHTEGLSLYLIILNQLLFQLALRATELYNLLAQSLIKQTGIPHRSRVKVAEDDMELNLNWNEFVQMPFSLKLLIIFFETFPF